MDDLVVTSQRSLIVGWRTRACILGLFVMGVKGRKKYYYGGERSLFIRILLYGCVEMRI